MDSAELKAFDVEASLLLRGYLHELARAGGCCLHDHDYCPPTTSCAGSAARFELRGFSLHTRNCALEHCQPDGVGRCVWEPPTWRGCTTPQVEERREVLALTLQLARLDAQLRHALRTGRFPRLHLVTPHEARHRAAALPEPAATLLAERFVECWERMPLSFRRRELVQAADWLGVRPRLWRLGTRAPRAFLWCAPSYRTNSLLERLWDLPELAPQLTCRGYSFRGDELLVLGGPIRLLAALARGLTRSYARPSPIGLGPDPTALFPRGTPSPAAELALTLWLDVPGRSGLDVPAASSRLDAIRDHLARFPLSLVDPPLPHHPDHAVPSIAELLDLADLALAE